MVNNLQFSSAVPTTIEVSDDGIMTLKNNHYTTVDITVQENCNGGPLLTDTISTTAFKPNLKPM
jgi:hypothetical protein